ncbi:hypothetical protein BDA99DRAFT_562159 [Phascolomyces articulosus]|uniref:Subtilisin inhibitor domain-containing protein n=1 Tax=Phascolomyces articulosus TaxID=60185 RepID=A0AAD5JUZ0_9FUNG|nr:hypothetical protein BDA99DRAFT_562159 [Phascolomyces articulosus]
MKLQYLLPFFCSPFVAMVSAQQELSQPNANNWYSPPPKKSSTFITVNDNTGGLHEWTLACNPIGGNHPRTYQACLQIEKFQDSLEDTLWPDFDRICPSIYQPETLIISGVFKDQQKNLKQIYPNHCVFKNTLINANLPDLIPFALKKPGGEEDNDDEKPPALFDEPVEIGKTTPKKEDEE